MAGPSSRSRGGISCPAFAALGFRCIAPDMRGYGRSSTYARHEDFAQELIVADMLELLASLGRDRGGVDRPRLGQPGRLEHGRAPPRQDGRRREPLRAVSRRRASRSTPCVPLVDRSVYPEAEYPAGQWDYQFFYEESFDKALRGLRGQHPQRREGAVPQGQSRRRRQAVAHRGGAQGRRLVRRRRLARPAARCRRADRGRPGGLYRGADAQRLLRARLLVHEPQGQRRLRQARAERRQARDAGAVPARRSTTTTCETVHSRLAEPMRATAPTSPRSS